MRFLIRKTDRAMRNATIRRGIRVVDRGIEGILRTQFVQQLSARWDAGKVDRVPPPVVLKNEEYVASLRDKILLRLLRKVDREGSEKPGPADRPGSRLMAVRGAAGSFLSKLKTSAIRKKEAPRGPMKANDENRRSVVGAEEGAAGELKEMFKRPENVAIVPRKLEKATEDTGPHFSPEPDRESTEKITAKPAKSIAEGFGGGSASLKKTRLHLYKGVSLIDQPSSADDTRLRFKSKVGIDRQRVPHSAEKQQKSIMELVEGILASIEKTKIGRMKGVDLAEQPTPMSDRRIHFRSKGGISSITAGTGEALVADEPIKSITESVRGPATSIAKMTEWSKKGVSLEETSSTRGDIRIPLRAKERDVPVHMGPTSAEMVNNLKNSVNMAGPGGFSRSRIRRLDFSHTDLDKPRRKPQESSEISEPTKARKLHSRTSSQSRSEGPDFKGSSEKLRNSADDTPKTSLKTLEKPEIVGGPRFRFRSKSRLRSASVERASPSILIEDGLRVEGILTSETPGPFERQETQRLPPPVVRHSSDTLEQTSWSDFSDRDASITIAQPPKKISIRKRRPDSK